MTENLAVATSNEPVRPRTSMVSSRGSSLPLSSTHRVNVRTRTPWRSRLGTFSTSSQPSSGRNLAADRARRTTTYSAGFVVAFDADCLFTESP